ncbi:hypothetical protein ACFVYR_17880 [Streptomyces sp. NPDC058284]|uniref:hypothetical protein n=1 Tax=unclassified Streptomyces TaxID=2593676 RepID=UPI003655F873
MKDENATDIRESVEYAELGEAVVPEDPDDPTVVGEISDRRVVAVGTALIGICAAFIAYALLGGGDSDRRHPLPTAPVTYRVTCTGTADVPHPAGSERC